MKEQKEKIKDQKNPFEWAVFGISLLLLLGIFVYLAYQTYSQKSTPPELAVEYRPEPSANNPYRYHVAMHNRGGSTAEEVLLSFELKKDTVVLETAELQFAFAPQSSTREGWIIFSQDPATADTIVARVVGYKKP